MQVQSEIAKKWNRYRLVSHCSNGTNASRGVSPGRRLTGTMSNTYVSMGPSVTRTTHGAGNGNNHTFGGNPDHRSSARGGGVSADYLSTTMVDHSGVFDDSAMTSPNAIGCESTAARDQAEPPGTGSDGDDEVGHTAASGADGRGTVVALKRLDKHRVARVEERCIR